MRLTERLQRALRPLEAPMHTRGERGEQPRNEWIGERSIESLGCEEAGLAQSGHPTY